MIKLIKAMCLSLTLATPLYAKQEIPIIIEDNVDVIEINHFYDENGALVFDQVIYRIYNEETDKFDIIAWRLIKEGRKESIKDKEKWEAECKLKKKGPYVPEFIGDSKVPLRQKDKYVSIFLDGNQLRKVTATTVYETWTQYDPELSERSSCDLNLNIEGVRTSRRELGKLIHN